MRLKVARYIPVYASLILLTLIESYLAVLPLCKGQIRLKWDDYYLIAVCWIVCTIAAGIGFYFVK
ncbi:MAG TPA: hypothetical protein PLA90_08400, partial [Candidatus Sumerlaeota bacterium]|nr:hypothetical protein [Candidatus Sumerlaeota bacterium]